MASAEPAPRSTGTQVIEGTPAEIIERLQTLNGNTRLTLIIPSIAPSENAGRQLSDAQEAPHADMTFAQILAPLQQDFEESGMTDEELGDLIDAELKACRAERQAREQNANGG